MSSKPLFIPLKAEYYEQFANGTKTTEYRAHGKRWNPETCYIGRDVVLSYGYGKARRMQARIVAAEILTNKAASDAFREIYGTQEECIAIHLQITGTGTEMELFNNDIAMTGQGFMKDGKRIAPQDIYIEGENDDE
jgi:hypothetical protein